MLERAHMKTQKHALTILSIKSNREWSSFNKNKKAKDYAIFKNITFYMD